MDFPFRTPDAKTVNPGQFCIPTGPTIGTNVTKSATANTYGSYLEMIASTSAALYITGATVFGDALNTKYLQFMLGTGAGGAETAVYIFRLVMEQP